VYKLKTGNTQIAPPKLTDHRPHKKSLRESILQGFFVFKKAGIGIVLIDSITAKRPQGAVVESMLPPAAKMAFVIYIFVRECFLCLNSHALSFCNS